MSDRELLEMAAKAAGIKVKGIYEDEDTLQIKPGPGMPPARWNPLADDGDALRLAVKLRINVELTARTVLCATDGTDPSEAVLDLLGDDPYAATRRAIVRASAEIGKAMP